MIVSQSPRYELGRQKEALLEAVEKKQKGRRPDCSQAAPICQSRGLHAIGLRRLQPVALWDPLLLQIQPPGLRSEICIRPLESLKSERKRPRRIVVG